MRWVLLLLAVATWGCDEEGGGGGPVDATAPDASSDAALEAGLDSAVVDAEPLDAALEPDAAEGDAAWLPLDPALIPPEPAPLRAGVAVRRMPVPLGIGTSGYGPTQADGYRTPFQEFYPGTRHIHLHPDFRVVVLEAGDQRLYFIRTDTIGISAQIRRDLVVRLEARYGPGVDQRLVIAATHTHSGPGRLIDKPLWRLIQDAFWPELYTRVVDGLEETVVAAVDDLEPARLGHTVAMSAALHGDRRCANPPEEDPAFPVVRVDRADGEIKALMLFHTIHGTVLGMDEYTLSQDVTGGIEAKVAELFEAPVMVMFLNGAAADVSPGSPPVAAVEGAAPWPGSYARIERVGIAAAELVGSVVDDIATRPEVTLFARTARAPIDRTILGYGEGEFPYEHGAVYCGAAFEERCVGEPPYDNLLQGCLPIPNAENTAPTQAPLTVGQIDDLAFITTPGEFSVSLGRVAAEAAEEALGLPVAIIGYAQEYTGYSLTETDWWQGGYESSGALWGPRQGDYLAGAIASLARSYANPRLPLAFADQAPLAAKGPYDFEPRGPDPSPGEAAILVDAPAQAGPGEVVRFEFSGGDPWLGNPVVTLERQTEDGFTPELGGGRPYTSDGYAITLELRPEPPYSEESAERTLRWIATLPIVRPFGGGPTLRGGTFRFVARGRIAVGAGAPAAYTLTSAAFTVAD